MKAIILAAGRGERMGKYTEALPKGMLFLNGKPLVAHQMDVLRQAGIEDISIVTGYRGEVFSDMGARCYHNAHYTSTNMVESLLCARETMNDDILVSYADILYTVKLAKRMMEHPGEVSVAVDPDWRSYWLLRYGTVETDLEALKMAHGRIVGIGEPVTSPAEMECRYVGLNKFSKGAMASALVHYNRKRANWERWTRSGSTFLKGSMTDLLGELIDAGVETTPVMAGKQWLEFDTGRDYELVLEKLRDGTLSTVFEWGN